MPVADKSATDTPSESPLQGDEIAAAVSGREGTSVQERAAAGVASGSGGALPHRDQIQASFGRHDVRPIEAHVGGEAAQAAADIGAQAYATRNQVAFAEPPDLHTAAHEAAHVVQQRGGVQLKEGVGRVGDRYEQHADAVADRVVAGKSAEALLDENVGGASGDALQMRNASPDMDEPVASDSRPGFIDNDDGSNIRNRPAELPGSRPLTTRPLPPATRVFASGRHPRTAEWWYVTAFLPHAIARGYVQGFRVTTNLPEPTAKLYQLKPGDTAEALAAREFSSAIRDGHDLRYYENVLLYVNRKEGRAGVTGTYQDPNLLGGSDNNVQLMAGRRIWLVSPAYARTLEGVVSSGSLTGGAVAKARRFCGHITDLVQSVIESPSHLDEIAGEYAQAIRDHMVEIVGIVSGFIMAEAVSAFAAATPTGVGQVAAVVIQLGLAAFGAAGMVQAGIEAVKHAESWLTIAWTAKGKDELITAASKEFAKMLVALAIAALARRGVKGNMDKAAALANSMPTALPAIAVAGGGQLRAGRAGTAVATGVPEPASSVGTAVAMSVEGEGEGAGAQDQPKESPQKRSVAEESGREAGADATKEGAEAVGQAEPARPVASRANARGSSGGQPAAQARGRAEIAAREAETDAYLRGQGRTVEPNPAEGQAGTGRQGDRIVDGVKTEYKHPRSGADSGVIRNEVNNSIRRGGQARRIIIDARGTGLTEEEAARGINRAMGIARGKIDVLEVIGDGYHVRN